jgi:hypothetical protein
MSGKSNVVFWLRSQGVQVEKSDVDGRYLVRVRNGATQRTLISDRFLRSDG